jgi:hypothetical protein
MRTGSPHRALKLSRPGLRNDTTVRDSSGPGYDGPHAAALWDEISMRDFASQLIGSILGVKPHPQPEWTEKEWAPYRETVLKALKEAGIEPPKDE